MTSLRVIKKISAMSISDESTSHLQVSICEAGQKPVRQGPSQRYTKNSIIANTTISQLFPKTANDRSTIQVPWIRFTKKIFVLYLPYYILLLSVFCYLRFYFCFRIYPTYIVAFLFYCLINKAQPYSYNVIRQHTENCDKYWWRNILFISNFFDPEKLVS